MQIALRSTLAAGVAAVGAGVIAMTPTAAPPTPVATPQTASPDVALGALGDLLPPPSVGSGALLGVGNAIAGGANLAVAPVVALRSALPPAPFVPPGVQLSLLTGTPNLGAGNAGNFNTGIGNTGDFVNVPRGTVHRFQNTGTETARIILTFTPAGIEHWFEETLERAPNEARTEDVPDNFEEVAARYDAAAPRYGIEFV